MADTVVRQWTMLARIPLAPSKVDTGTLQAHLASRGYRVDPRSIQRDLRKLARVLPLVCDSVHRPHGWSWARDAATANDGQTGILAALAGYARRERPG
jgi:hypothetical protein